MGFTIPAVHYSALATLPPELTSTVSQQSIQNTTNIRFKLNEILKKLFNNDIHNQTLNKENDTSMILKNPNNDKQISLEQESLKSPTSFVEPLERLPFTEPYFSITSKNEQIPFQLSAYHKHCIQQEKYIDQKQYHPDSLLSNKQNYQSQKLITNQLHEIKLNKKISNSTTTLPQLSSSIEDHIGFKYASQKNTLTTNHSIRSSYIQQQTQSLRRLQSKSKLRSISNESKPLSSSIAQRIELLKQAMHNNHSSIEPPSSLSSSSIIDTIHKQTQTNDIPLKSSEIHHIHHHHIHSSSSSSFFSISWRTYLSLIGTITMIFLLLIQFITINF